MTKIVPSSCRRCDIARASSAIVEYSSAKREDLPVRLEALVELEVVGLDFFFCLREMFILALTTVVVSFAEGLDGASAVGSDVGGCCWAESSLSSSTPFMFLVLSVNEDNEEMLYCSVDYNGVG